MKKELDLKGNYGIGIQDYLITGTGINLMRR